MSSYDRYATTASPKRLSRNALIAGGVVLLHVAALWAFQSGLAHKVVAALDEARSAFRPGDAVIVKLDTAGGLSFIEFDLETAAGPTASTNTALEATTSPSVKGRAFQNQALLSWRSSNKALVA